MPLLPHVPQLRNGQFTHLALAAAALVALICAPELALAQASPFMTGASSLQTNARVAREFLVALPVELSPQARVSLVTGFSRELVERHRFALDIAIHAPRDYPGSDPRNFHAHLLATTREVTLDGLGAKTPLEWSDTNRRQSGLGPAVGELLQVRKSWAQAANAALEQEHVNSRIDHRTLRAQGIDREPRPYIPRVAFEMERRGYYSVVAERMRAEYQGRVEARLARTSHHEPPEAAPKSLEEIRKESALNWLRYRREQAQTQEQNQAEPDPVSARRTRNNDHSM
jgi:MobA/MobL family